MIFPDSSVWIDYFNGKIDEKTDLLDSVLGARRVIVGDLVLMEVLQGFRSEREFNTANDLLRQFDCVTLGGRETAVAAAQNYRRLRAAGVTVRKTIDVTIATFCIENGHVLLHSDRDFDAMETGLGLRVLR